MKTKEQQEQTNYYDYGFRQFDAQLARWHVVDALAERYFSESPYNYVGNNPINYTDFMGLTKRWQDPDKIGGLNSWLHGGGITSFLNGMNNHIGNNLHGISQSTIESNFGFGGHLKTNVTIEYDELWEKDKNGKKHDFIEYKITSVTYEDVWVWDSFSFSGKAARKFYKSVKASKGKVSPVMIAIAYVIREFQTFLGIPNPFNGADAIAGDIGVIAVGQEYDQGAIFILSGKNIGEIHAITEEAYGGGTDAGTGFEIVRMDLIKGNKDDLVLNDFLGKRYKGAMGAEIYGFISAGITVGMSFPAKRDGLTTGFQVGVGASFLGAVYFNFNVGQVNQFPKRP